MNKDVQIAKQTIKTELRGLKKLYRYIGSSKQFSKAVNLITKATGKVIATGTGKSFNICTKISSTLSSLGTPSTAYDSSSLNHGSMGAIQKGHDVLLIFSVSGNTEDLNSILRVSNRNNIPVIGVSCKPSSLLLRFSTIPILLPRVDEVRGSLAPTSSQINFLAFGDSLAHALAARKKFNNKHFVALHPHGQLATALVTVSAIMVKGKDIPFIDASKTMRQAVEELTRKRLGIVVVKNRGKKISLITDGDCRREANNLYNKSISSVATKNPIWISDSAAALKAIELMSQKKITSLLVARNQDINKKLKGCVGVIHMHEILLRGIK